MCDATKLIRTDQKKFTYMQWKNKSQEMLNFKLHGLSINRELEMHLSSIYNYT